MSIRDLRDLIKKAEEKVQQKKEQRRSSYTTIKKSKAPEQKTVNSGEAVVIQVSLKDLVNRYCKEQQLNPVIQNCNVIIEKVQDHPSGTVFQIQQLFLDNKNELIFTDASRQKVKGVIYKALTLDDMLMRRLADAEYLEFNL